jgi:hypothetical protein
MPRDLIFTDRSCTFRSRSVCFAESILSPEFPKQSKYMNSQSIAIGLATVALSTVAISSEAQAATITSLYSTGVDNNGVVRVRNDNGSLTDLHYTLTAAPTAGELGSTRLNRHPAWLANNSTSAWIAPVNLNGNQGNYTYTTTFDLTGLSPNTAQISGQWSTDNTLISILLNGQSTGINSGANGSTSGFTSFTPFSINNTANFLPGVNTLSFTITNAPFSGVNPTGFRVELAGTANTATSVPEPFTIIGTIVGGTAALRLRKKLKAEADDKN